MGTGKKDKARWGNKKTVAAPRGIKEHIEGGHCVPDQACGLTWPESQRQRAGDCH
eukprot:CAMPEP_0119349388 /NCGR_PEP_ID=MMETSP1333-20130426/109524_1 /TAXON_ID=418940 /ORGANISM="Scyphosphaera apsteinii, Strain RCC1455" /LENGTH=54 /DNA_ID=CAMNT_0007361981 /DNA_START=16 /DNA_END=180 /DNA_ORIENTATION=+